MTVITPAKVARNLTWSFFEMGHKRCNSSDHISMSEICARELRATLLGNQSDWKPTHETTYQHTRRRCDGRRMVRRARAGFATRRRAKRDRQVSRADGPSDARNNATAAAPVMSRCTRYGARHPLRGTTPDQKRCNAYGSGAPPPTTSTTASIFSRHTQAAASDAATQPRNTRPAPNKRRYTRSVALHPIRRGVMPTDRV